MASQIHFWHMYSNLTITNTLAVLQSTIILSLYRMIILLIIIESCIAMQWHTYLSV